MSDLTLDPPISRPDAARAEAHPAGTTTVGVVIVTYRSARHVLGALGSLASAAHEVSVVVVDNASTDGTAAAVRAGRPDVLVVESATNEGFARACNRGVDALSRGGSGEPDLVLFLNPDTVLDDGALDVAVRHLQSDPGIGALGGRTRHEDGSVNPTCCFARPTLWSALCYASGLASLRRASSWTNPEQMGGWDRGDTRDVDVVTGCFLLMRTADFRRVGGFDEDFFLYSEDTDLATRLRSLGLRCVHAHDVGLVHVGGGSDRVRSEKLAKVYAARLRYYDKHWSPRSARLGRRLLLAGVALRRVGSAPAGGPRAETWQAVWRQRRQWAAPVRPAPAATSDRDPDPDPVSLSPAVRLPARRWETQARIGYRVLRHVQRSLRRGDLDFVGQGLATAARLPGLVVGGLLGPERCECNVCGWTGPRFLPNTGPGYHEQDVTCPGCSSLDRHRSLLALLLTRTDLFGPGRRVVEVAPMRGFEALLRAQPGLDYTSFDLERHAMERGDITAMRYPTGSVDYFLCFHVLEHIPDATTALAEIRRVLAPGGTGIFQVPVDWSAPRTREYAAPDPRDVGHVRQYGADFADHLARAGLQVTDVSVEDTLDDETIARFGLSREPVFLARRPEDG